MAKTPKLKSKAAPNPRSRASRRQAASTPLDKTVENLKPIPPPTTSTSATKPPSTTPKTLPHHISNAGISKKQRVKPLSRQQKIRREKTLLRAEGVVDKFQVKLQGSVRREKKVKDRRKGWDEVNVLEGVDGGEKVGKSEKGGVEVENGKPEGDEEVKDGEDEWMDEDDGGDGEGTEEVREKDSAPQEVDDAVISGVNDVEETPTEMAVDNAGIDDHEATTEDDKIT